MKLAEIHVFEGHEYLMIPKQGNAPMLLLEILAQETSMYFPIRVVQHPLRNSLNENLDEQYFLIELNPLINIDSVQNYINLNL